MSDTVIYVIAEMSDQGFIDFIRKEFPNWNVYFTDTINPSIAVDVEEFRGFIVNIYKNGIETPELKPNKWERALIKAVGITPFTQLVFEYSVMSNVEEYVQMIYNALSEYSKVCREEDLKFMDT